MLQQPFVGNFKFVACFIERDASGLQVLGWIVRRWGQFSAIQNGNQPSDLSFDVVDVMAVATIEGRVHAKDDKASNFIGCQHFGFP